MRLEKRRENKMKGRHKRRKGRHKRRKRGEIERGSEVGDLGRPSPSQVSAPNEKDRTAWVWVLGIELAKRWRTR